jgi:hypothetical protein
MVPQISWFQPLDALSAPLRWEAVPSAIATRLLLPVLFLVAIWGVGTAIRSRFKLTLGGESDISLVPILAGLAGMYVPLEMSLLFQWNRFSQALPFVYFSVGMAGAWVNRRQFLEGIGKLRLRPSFWVASAFALVVLLTYALDPLPPPGDTLAFLLHSKLLLLREFNLGAIDPAQQIYPDLFILWMTSISQVFRVDPAVSLIGLGPLLLGMYLFILSEYFSACFKTESNVLFSVAAVVAATASKNPFREGFEGRFPYLLSLLIVIYLLKITVTQVHLSRRGFACLGAILGLAWVAHPSCLPLLVVPVLLVLVFSGPTGERIHGSLRSQLSRLFLLAAGFLVVSFARALVIVKNVKWISRDPETQTQAWESLSDFTSSLLRWPAQFIAPLSPSYFISGALVVGIVALVVRSKPSFATGILAPLAVRARVQLLLLVLILFVGSLGISESVGISFLSSHYNKRHFGLLHTILVGFGLATLIEVAWGGAAWRRRIQIVLATFLGVHCAQFFGVRAVNSFERFQKRVARHPDEVRAVQAWAGMMPNTPTGGPAGPGDNGLEGILTFGSVGRFIFYAHHFGRYLPYFFPDHPHFLSFVPHRGFFRSNRDHLSLYRKWLLRPRAADVLEELSELGVHLFYLPKRAIPSELGQLVATLKPTDPYQVVFENSGALILRLRGGKGVR